MKLLIYTREFPTFLGELATTSYELSKDIAAQAMTIKNGFSINIDYNKSSIPI